MEDADDPGRKSYHLTAGDVLLRDEGTVKFSSPSKGRGELSSSNSAFSDDNLFA